MGESGAEESDDGWLDDCSSDDEPPVARGRSPDAQKSAPSALAGSSARDGTDSRDGNNEAPKEATEGWGVEELPELSRAHASAPLADDAHRKPFVGAAGTETRLGDPSADSRDGDDEATNPTDAPYLDFSVKSPWERTSRVVETAARSWLRLTDKELRERSMVNDSRPDHGSRDLRFLRLVVPSHDQTTRRRADPVAVLLYYREDARRPNVLYVRERERESVALRDEKQTQTENEPKTKPTKPARSRTNVSCVSQLATCAPEDDLSPGASGLQRWFGAGGANGAPFAVVEPLSPRVSPLGDFVSGTFADVDEATAAKAAVAVAFSAAGVPSHWPVFAPVLGPARRAFVGRTGDDDGVFRSNGANASGGALSTGWSVRYETDSLEGVAAERAHARTVHGLCDVLRAQLAALHGVQTADALVADAKVTARLAFVLGRTRESRRRRIESNRIESSSPPLDASGSSGESSDASSGASSSDGERGDIRAGEAFLAVAGGAAPPRRRRRGKRAERKEGADENLDEEEKEDERREPKDRRFVFRKEREKDSRFFRWDDLAPWAPWATVPDPWRRVEVHATYREVSLESLRADESANANALSLEAAPEWTVRAVPRGAAEAAKETFFSKETSFPDFSGPETFSGPGTRRGASSDDDASWVRADGQSHGDPPRGLAELYYLLSRSAGTRGARGAETMGRLASAEFWDDETETGVSPPPRAPPESVVQDVLRDIFESGSSLSKMTRAGRERTFADDVSEMSRAKEEEGAKTEKGKKKETPSFSFRGEDKNENENAESLFPNPARSAPPDSLLARLALHALVFGNARAVATLWRRFVREIRFAHWDRGVPLPRTGGVGFEAERRRKSLRESLFVENENENESLDEDERVFRDEQVDTRACVAHQKIQLINACIRRRKAGSVDAYERSDAARERRDREARATARRNPSAGGRNDGEDATAATTFLNANGLRSSDTPRAKSPDDDVDLVALLGATADPARVSSDEKGGFGVFGRAVSDEADGFVTASDGGDDESLAADEPDDPVTGVSFRAPEGVKRTHPSGLRLLAPPHRRMRVPETQPPPVFTEDAAREREAAMHALGDTPEGRAARARLQSDQLVSDMSAFKAANPGACLADFVRWHSPRDWVEEETDQTDQTDQISDGMCHVEADAADSTESTESASARRRDRFAPKPGRLSARMEGCGGGENLWKTLWRDAPIVPASRQKPLFDPIREGERALEYLDAAPPPEIFAQILAAAAAAVGDTYASFSVTSSSASSGEENKPNVKRVDAPSREALRRANAMASRVLRRACPYESEYAAVAGELQRAERAVARAAALARRMPGVDADIREALLLAAADDEARADAEVAETERSVEANGCSGDAGDAGDSGSQPEASAAPRPPPRVVEALLPRTHPERRRESALSGLIPREKNGAESAAHAEYVVRAGGGHAQTHRAHAVTAPCFIRVSSAVAYQY